MWGSDLQLTDEVMVHRYTLGGVSVSASSLPLMSVTIALVAVLVVVVQRTSMGRALRAVAENRDVARLLGVSAAGSR